MMTLSIFAGLAYFVVGCGVAFLSLSELSASGRARRRNRLMALAGALLWPPTLLLVVIAAALRALLPRPSTAVAMTVARRAGGAPGGRV